MPNLKIATGTSTNFLSIRGLGSGSNARFEQSVGTFVDRLYRPRAVAINAALFDVDRVEVLKGPQSTFAFQLSERY
jgi:outer membrane receptor protein involved in Fe transport